ncbi:MAG: hypothetical protein OXK76_07590 [Gammaproteobacteria bacterium]|nr:hypothetical protein [Gammaproteobacteria bacterium]
MKASHHRTAASWGRGLLLPALLAACGESPRDGDAPAPTVDVADCEDVPFRGTAEGFRTRIGNWRLAYGRLCPIAADALSGCTQLADATPAESLACIRENVERDADCPGEMRDTLLDVVADMERSEACRVLYVTLSRDAIADAFGKFDDLPQGDLDDIATICHNRHWFHPEAAARCVDKTVADRRAAIERQRELEAARDARTDAFDAAVSAADLDPAPSDDRVRLLGEHCTAGEPGPAAVAECAEAAFAALAAQRDALAQLPEERRQYTLNRCIQAGFSVVSRADIADAACLHEDAAAYAEIAEHYAEHFERCGARSVRYSDVARCAKARWLTRDRMAAAKAAAVEKHIAHLQPEGVRRSIARQCTAGTLYIAREPFVAGEHPNDIVARRVGTCAEGHVAAYAALRRFAGRTHAGAVDDCIGRYIWRYGWSTIARCLRDAAREAGDAAFADALSPCVGRRRSVEDLVDCPGVPER